MGMFTLLQNWKERHEFGENWSEGLDSALPKLCAKLSDNFVLCLKGSHTFSVAFHCLGLPTLSSASDFFFFVLTLGNSIR